MKIGIDLGGTKTEAILIDDSGKEIFRKRIKTEKNYQGTLLGIISLVEEIEKDTLEGYSERVKQRMAQLKKVWHDERRAKEAAERETKEEACTDVLDSKLYALFNLPQINQVYMMFLSRLASEDFSPGEETLDCRLYAQKEIPWESIAFPTITHSLKFFFDDRSKGVFNLHLGDIIREGSTSRLVILPDLS